MNTDSFSLENYVILENIFTGKRLYITMATQHGYEIAIELEKQGWKLILPPENTYGDPTLIDPLTGKEFDPFRAEIEQGERDFYNRHDNLPELNLD